jgi:hypothetical protein
MAKGGIADTRPFTGSAIPVFRDMARKIPYDQPRSSEFKKIWPAGRFQSTDCPSSPARSTPTTALSDYLRGARTRK